MIRNIRSGPQQRDRDDHSALHSVRPEIGKLLGWAAAALLLASLGPGHGAAAQQTPKPLRLCADPTNLPFSSADPKVPGVYLEIGEAIGRAMGRPVEPVWNLTYFGKRALRTTLLAGKCDAAIGLPQDPDFMGPKLTFSKPFLQIGYALVVPNASVVASLDDLKGRRVAVQFATTPQNLLAYRDDITTVTVREPEDAMQALAAGQADAAFIWGPVAGYVNKTALNNAYRIVPVDGPGLQWPAAIGFPKGERSLRDQVDQAIDHIAGDIELLKNKYGLPTGAPMKAAQSEPQAHIVLAAAEDQSAGDAASGKAAPAKESQPAQPASSAAEANGKDVAEGRELFDGTCAHCHGTDAVVAERRVNLRLMQRRYHDKMDETFLYTVTHGRPEKGMPNWTGVFTDEQFAKILAYIHTVQTH
ncbi:MAG: transporter substrate-binding domain-containing protein [Acetobacteraceae bacterium]|nr:transporter substrate-binding domain-containing protein [Acetobacteraceae bacterium]